MFSSKKVKRIESDELSDILKSKSCKRLPEMDVDLLEAYQISDSSILLDMAGEAGYIFEKEDLEKLISETERNFEKYKISEEAKKSGLETTKSEAVEYIEVVEVVRPNSFKNLISDQPKSLDKNPENIKEQVVEVINFFSRISFFSREREEFNLVDSLVEKIYKDNLIEKPEGFFFGDIDVLKWDESRVWWRDLEADVCPGNSIYVSVLEKLSSISRNQFIIHNVAEIWEGDEGPISVHFSFEDKRHEINHAYLNDWIDLNIVREINSILENKSYQFEIAWTGEQSTFVTMLMSWEKELIIQERGWKFLT